MQSNTSKITNQLDKRPPISALVDTSWENVYEKSEVQYEDGIDDWKLENFRWYLPYSNIFVVIP